MSEKKKNKKRKQKDLVAREKTLKDSVREVVDIHSLSKYSILQLEASLFSVDPDLYVTYLESGVTRLRSIERIRSAYPQPRLRNLLRSCEDM